jgi:hypothetical protein
MNAGVSGIIQNIPPLINSLGSFSAPNIPPTDMKARAREKANVA